VITVPADEMARLLTALRDEYQGSVDELLAAARRGGAVRHRAAASPTRCRRGAPARCWRRCGCG
jgi:hypothetical protein